MNDELEFDSLEGQLRREARDISKPYGGMGSAAAIRAIHRRRRRRTIRRFSAAAAFLGLIVGVTWWSMTRPTSQDVRPVVAESPAPMRPLQRQPEEANVARKSIAEHEPQDSNDIPSEPVTFLVTAKDGRRVIAVGRYVPPRTERVNLRDLPPLEEAAVRRVLGLADDEVKPTI